jgi:hypothetical protein
MSRVDTDDELARLWQADEPELLALLGAALVGEGIGFSPEDPEERRRFAERWLAQRMDRIRERVCSDQTRTLLQRDVGDRMLEAATVADAVATLGNKPAVHVLAVLLLKRGVHELCGPDGSR